MHGPDSFPAPWSQRDIPSRVITEQSKTFTRAVQVVHKSKALSRCSLAQKPAAPVQKECETQWGHESSPSSFAAKLLFKGQKGGKNC